MGSMTSARSINTGRFKSVGSVVALALLLLQSLAGFALGADRWQNLTPRERENVRKNYQHWQNLPPKDKEHLREEWNRWQNLPQDRREQLRDRYEDLRRRRQNKG
jgi:hypothetical protein